ncbi:hypothetical protein XMD564_001498 [Marinobacterium sp. xm-d-564]|nr:hypothetical protein [Marinobacterium sp. xm-d-564]
MREKLQDLSLFQLPQNFRGASPVKVQSWWVVQALLFYMFSSIYVWLPHILINFFQKNKKSCLLEAG